MTPLDPVSIFNLAADEAPCGTIVSMQEDSPEARAGRRQYPHAVERWLETANWTFARKREAMPMVVNRSHNWGFAYKLPGDVMIPIRVRSAPVGAGVMVVTVGQQVVRVTEEDTVGDLMAPPPYVIVGDTLLTHEPGAVLEYVSDEIAGRVSALAREALVLMLAAKLVMACGNKDRRQQQALEQKAKAMLEEAAAADANKEPRTYGNHIPEVVWARLR